MGAAEDDFTHTTEFAQRLGLEGEDADRFVSDSMKRLGHKPRVVWDDADPEEGGGEDEGDFFTRKRTQKQTPARQTREVPRGKGSGGDWQYGG